MKVDAGGADLQAAHAGWAAGDGDALHGRVVHAHGPAGGGGADDAPVWRPCLRGAVARRPGCADELTGTLASSCRLLWCRTDGLLDAL
jgi:hypothetical protein